LGFIAFKIKLSILKKWAWLFVLINLIFMVLVFVPGLGIVAGGAPRWMNLGFVSFQPSEFLKLTFIIYLAAWLTRRTEKSRGKGKGKSPSFREEDKGITLAPFFVIVGIITLLLAKQSDVSTLGTIILVAALMYFSTGTPLWHSILIFLVSLGGLLLLIKIAPYRMMRFRVLLGSIKDPMGIGYQIKQALITIGSGGILGLGLGMSNQQFGFIPQTMSDSIFAIFAEETGFVGSSILILLFLILFWRGFMIFRRSHDKFSQLFAIGVSSWICTQAFVNIGAMIGILPLTGIPLPFISYGGSHIVAELIAMGILLNISKTARK
jgi:cell division protein FtsW